MTVTQVLEGAFWVVLEPFSGARQEMIYKNGVVIPL